MPLTFGDLPVKSSLRATGLFCALGAVLSACHRDQPARPASPSEEREPEAAAPSRMPETAQTSSSVMMPLPAGEWTVLRVGGDEQIAVTGQDGSYRCPTIPGLLIDTPLPVGYPAPTPPGAIELKKYPSVRRAEKSGSMAPDIGMNFAFFPLFNHIQRRDIAMTSPVEMDYRGTERWSQTGELGRAPDEWTMSFLYREPANGDTGVDRGVSVVDTKPLTVISIGLRGRYSWEKSRAAIGQLLAWLSSHPEWVQSGDARALYYNGPDRRTADLWAEVQLPVSPAGLDAAR